MLILHQIEKTHFSPSEKEIINYVLTHSDQLDDLSIQAIAEATYTSAPIVIRAAKKLGLSGWNDLKKQLKKEIEYLYANNEIDASIPFVITDTFTNISKYIAKLETETIADTMSLLSHDLIYSAMSLLGRKKVIDIYSDLRNQFLVQDFASKLRVIDYQVNTSCLGNDDYYVIAKSNEEHVAIVVAYSLDYPRIIEVLNRLKEKQQKVVLITSLDNAEMDDVADCVLTLSSREMRYTKIGEFSSTTSLKLILDILYSCLFSLNYETNLNKRITLYKEIDETQGSEE